MKLTIAKKNTLGYTVMTLLIMILGFTSYSGAYQLSAILNYITTNAWSAADGAMEGTIGLQAQIININAITDSKATDTKRESALDELKQAEAQTVDALQRMKASGLIPDNQITRLDEHLAIFAQSKKQTLDLNHLYLTNASTTEQLDLQLLEFTNVYYNLLEFLSELEEIGDSQVESQLGKIQSVQSTTLTSIISVCILAVIFSILVTLYSIKSIARPIANAAEQLRKIADEDGDLNSRLPVTGNDEITDLSNNFNSFVSKLQSTIKNISQSTAIVADSGHNLSLLTEQTSQAVNHQFNETSSVASAVNQMTASISEVASNASRAADAAASTKDEAGKGNNTIKTTLQIVNNLSKEMHNSSTVIQGLYSDTESIGSVLEVIRGIAEQTNLLALNAAIEAARAGEQGRGFAVVADEVRTLATRTQTSTEEIHSMIESLQHGAQSAVKAIESSLNLTQSSVDKVTEVQKSFEAITRMIDDINDMNTQVSVATEEQSAVSDEINHNIVNINHAAEQVSASIKQIADTTLELTQQSGQLKLQVDQFNT